MKRVNKLAASVAVALSLGIVSQANALIELEANSTGDALLFPVFWGYSGVENYFTIMNNDNNWIQGHLRFRGAVWCGELLDMDIILSPGDVFVFRVADVDGDGMWEIDQSLDSKNFEYTGMLSSCKNEITGGIVENCRDQSNLLIPEADDKDTPSGNITQSLIDHHRRVGQIEFIAEGVFLPQSTLTARMASFIDSDNAGKLASTGQRQTGNDLGTHLWSWVNGYQAYPNGDTTKGVATENGFEHQDDVRDMTVGSDTNGKNEERWATDVGNVLSGTAFLSKVGDSTGVAYNAEALVNFRTDTYGGGSHRVENYPDDIGVILHHEDSLALGNPQDYAYAYAYEEYSSNNLIQNFEARISYNNTWGPTLADGDDYNIGTPAGDWLSQLVPFDGPVDDVWDKQFASNVNSIAEVSAAVRTTTNTNVPRQNFTSFYMDGGTLNESATSSLSSYYFSFAPIKFFVGEDTGLWYNPNLAEKHANFQSSNKLRGKRGYIAAAVNRMNNASKDVKLEIWDILENTPRTATQECDVSPCLPEGGVIGNSINLREQVAFFAINGDNGIKNKFGETGDHQSWKAGRVVMSVNPDENKWCSNSIPVKCPNNYPILLYTFDMQSDLSVSHWRSMHRGFNVPE